eukprot:3379709-Pyramimonas_sp.AAC.1
MSLRLHSAFPSLVATASVRYKKRGLALFGPGTLLLWSALGEGATGGRPSSGWPSFLRLVDPLACAPASS